MNLDNYNQREAAFVAYEYAASSCNEINIDGDNLMYAQLGNHHHGLQCNHIGDTKEYNLIMEKCAKVAKLLQEIKELNTVQK